MIKKIKFIFINSFLRYYFFVIHNISLLIIVGFIIGCSCSVGGGNKNQDVSPTPIDSDNDISIKLESHNNNTYYTTKSDTPSYVVLTVYNNESNNVIIQNITQTNSIDFNIIDSSNNGLYPLNALICAKGTTLVKNQYCQIIVQLRTPKLLYKAINVINIQANNKLYEKVLQKHPYLYIGGNFSQTYDSNPILDNGSLVSQQSIVNSYDCGVNGNALCALLEYDVESKIVRKIAQTNYAINTIAVDDDGVLYVAGEFDVGYSQVSSGGGGGDVVVEGPTSSLTKTLILTVNPVISGDISDFIKKVTTNGNINYPNGAVSVLNFNQNKLYMAGIFNDIGNILSSKYPIVNYDFTNNNWGNIFTNIINDDSKDPDGTVTTIGFDNQNNLFISGYYSQASNFINNNLNSALSINRCKLNNLSDLYECGNDINIGDFLYLYNSVLPQPAYTINLFNDYVLFTGGFSSITNQYTTGAIESYTIASFDPFTSTWGYFTNNDFTGDKLPNRQIGTIVTYESGLYIGGWFSSIGGIRTNNIQRGECGLSGSALDNGVNSCLLAQYNAKSTTKWNQVFATDGIINSIAINAKIE